MVSLTSLHNITAINNFSDRRVMISVTGACPQAGMRRGQYTMAVPYSCLSQTIQGIHRWGGRVTNVTMPDSDISGLAPIQLHPAIAVAAAETTAPSQSRQTKSTRQTTKPTNGAQEQRSKRKPKS